MGYVKVGAICAKPGCTKVHHERSKYCYEHLQEQRDAHGYYSTAPLALARAVLNAPDLPHQLRPPEAVQVLNLATWNTSTIMSDSPALSRDRRHIAQPYT